MQYSQTVNININNNNNSIQKTTTQMNYIKPKPCSINSNCGIHNNSYCCNYHIQITIVIIIMITQHLMKIHNTLKQTKKFKYICNKKQNGKCK